MMVVQLYDDCTITGWEEGWICIFKHVALNTIFAGLTLAHPSTFSGEPIQGHNLGVLFGCQTRS